MKKNRMMRLAAILFVCVLLTTSVISGTFAKYTTSKSASDEARVAHWGFNAPAEVLFDLFDVSDDTGVAADGLIAPGTSNSVTFTLVNADAETAPEVAYKITVNTTGTTAELSAELEEALSFTLDGETYDTWGEWVTAIKDLSGSDDGSGVKEYAPNTPVPDAFANNAKHTIGWTWAFNRNDDEGDTALGNKAIAELEQLKLSIGITIEQIDTYSSN